MLEFVDSDLYFVQDKNNFINPLLQVGSGSGSGSVEKSTGSGSGGPKITGSGSGSSSLDKCIIYPFRPVHWIRIKVVQDPDIWKKIIFDFKVEIPVSTKYCSWTNRISNFILFWSLVGCVQPSENALFKDRYGQMVYFHRFFNSWH